MKMKTSSKVILRKLKQFANDNIEAFENWEEKLDYRGKRFGKGARGEARGTVTTCRELLQEIRKFK